MSIFNSGFFWFIEGILFCVTLYGFNLWMKDKNVPMNAGKWITVVLWIFLLGFTIAFVGTSLGENETQAAVKGGLLFGIITIIAGAGAWKFVTSGAGTDGR